MQEQSHLKDQTTDLTIIMDEKPRQVKIIKIAQNDVHYNKSELKKQFNQKQYFYKSTGNGRQDYTHGQAKHNQIPQQRPYKNNYHHQRDYTQNQYNQYSKNYRQEKQYRRQKESNDHQIRISHNKNYQDKKDQSWDLPQQKNAKEIVKSKNNMEQKIDYQQQSQIKDKKQEKILSESLIQNIQILNLSLNDKYEEECQISNPLSIIKPNNHSIEQSILDIQNSLLNQMKQKKIQPANQNLLIEIETPIVKKVQFFNILKQAKVKYKFKNVSQIKINKLQLVSQEIISCKKIFNQGHPYQSKGAFIKINQYKQTIFNYQGQQELILADTNIIFKCSNCRTKFKIFQIGGRCINCSQYCQCQVVDINFT